MHHHYSFNHPAIDVQHKQGQLKLAVAAFMYPEWHLLKGKNVK
jgi:hypothetical protein